MKEECLKAVSRVQLTCARVLLLMLCPALLATGGCFAWGDDDERPHRYYYDGGYYRDGDYYDRDGYRHERHEDRERHEEHEEHEHHER